MHVAIRPLRCMYYPYSRTLSEISLKKAVLLFDQLVFLDSQPWFLRKHMLEHAQKGATEAAEENYDYLSSEGVIEIQNPESIIPKYDLFITTNVMNEVRDEEFCKLAIKHDVTVWNVLTERIPPTFLEAFYPGAGTFSEAISLQALINSGTEGNEVGDGERSRGRCQRKQLASRSWRNMEQKVIV